MRVASFKFKYPMPCVYLLMAKGKVIYVGQTQNIFTRLFNNQKVKGFDSVEIIPTEKKNLLMTEFAFIQRYRPTYNKFGNFSPITIRRSDAKDKRLKE